MKDSNKNLALEIAKAAQSRKADDIVLIEVDALVDYADYIVICSGNSDRQVGAIADAIEETLSALHEEPIGIEGLRSRRWILLDYGAIVVHVFHKEVRPIYDLERLWFDAPRVTLSTEPALRPLTPASATAI